MFFLRNSMNNCKEILYKLKKLNNNLNKLHNKQYSEQDIGDKKNLIRNWVNCNRKWTLN